MFPLVDFGNHGKVKLKMEDTAIKIMHSSYSFTTHWQICI